MTNYNFILNEGERITIFEKKLFKRKYERIDEVFKRPNSIKTIEIINIFINKTNGTIRK